MAALGEVRDAQTARIAALESQTAQVAVLTQHVARLLRLQQVAGAGPGTVGPLATRQ